MTIPRAAIASRPVVVVVLALAMFVAPRLHAQTAMLSGWIRGGIESDRS